MELYIDNSTHAEKLDLDTATEKDPCFNIDSIIQDTDGGCKTNHLANAQDYLRLPHQL